MNSEEFVAISLTIAGMALYVTSAVLSLVFMLKHRENPWRMLPCVSVSALPVITLVPESGWSDIRSQWHQAALVVAWGIFALWLAMGFLKSEKGALSISLRVAFGVMGVVGFIGGI